MFRFDESDPRYLIAYETEHEHSIAPYQAFLSRWVARAERGVPFSVILVTDLIDDHDEDDEHTHERDVAFEEAFTKLLNDFRRDHKADVERVTTAYARVMAPAWIAEQSVSNPQLLDEARASTDRTSRYMWGIPGSLFGNVEEALAWLETQPNVAPPIAEKSAPAFTSERVGLFYGSTTGVTEVAALDIAKAWAAQGMEPIVAINIGTVKDLSTLLDYDNLILGIPTWNVGQLQDDWEIALSQLNTLDFTGKQVALFGVGDQYGYPDNFQDAVGILGAKLMERGATLVGEWNDGQYEFAESKAFVNGKFMGLALDEVQQAHMSDRRINQWVAQIITEFAGQPVAEISA